MGQTWYPINYNHKENIKQSGFTNKYIRPYEHGVNFIKW